MTLKNGLFVAFFLQNEHDLFSPILSRILPQMLVRHSWIRQNSIAQSYLVHSIH